MKLASRQMGTDNEEVLKMFQARAAEVESLYRLTGIVKKFFKRNKKSLVAVRAEQTKQIEQLKVSKAQYQTRLKNIQSEVSQSTLQTEESHMPSKEAAEYLSSIAVTEKLLSEMSAKHLKDLSVANYATLISCPLDGKTPE